MSKMKLKYLSEKLNEGNKKVVNKYKSLPVALSRY